MVYSSRTVSTPDGKRLLMPRELLEAVERFVEGRKVEAVLVRRLASGAYEACELKEP